MIDLKGKRILAPMVRVGSLPFRLMCLDYGADIVYSEEIIDRKLGRCERIVNEDLGCVDYIVRGKDPMHKPLPSDLAWRVAPQLEKPNLVLQLGTNNADTALQAAQLACQDVAWIDINMGCPKTFSTQMGAGAELLKQPQLVKEIVSKLSSNLPVPVTCKIRILPTRAKTLDLVRIIEQAGAAALTVHGRTDTMRSSEPPMWEEIAAISDVISIPLIANGGIWTREDEASVRKLTNCDAVMYARGALLNPSIFRNEGYLPMDQVIKKFLGLCCEWDEILQCTKYTLQQFYRYGERNVSASGLKTKDEIVIRGMKTHEELFAHYQLDFPLRSGQGTTSTTITTLPPSSSQPAKRQKCSAETV
jgi:tRNA-dihydrouridine synthase 2